MIKRKQRKLAHEILGLIGISGAVCLVLFFLLSGITTAIAEEYIFNNSIEMTEFDWISLDRQIFGGSALLACLGFSTIFLSLLNDRIAYIRKITQSIENLRSGAQDIVIPLQGANELTELASAINDMSAAECELKKKQQALAREKDELIHTLSHDIRTPLTSILAYSDYLGSKENITPEEQQNYIKLIKNKGEQIRDLTGILLDGARRSPENFENAKFLLEQIISEFEEDLEDRFQLKVDLSGCPDFSGCFDVQELRRIFDNLSSNIQKYADPNSEVILEIKTADGQIAIRQRNAVLYGASNPDSYRIGLNSMRRIAQHYSGQVTVNQSEKSFEIIITLNILANLTEIL